MEERKIAINPCPLGDEEILSFYSIIFLLFLSGSLATFIRHQTFALARSPVGVQIQTDQDNVSQRSTRARVTDRPTDRPPCHSLAFPRFRQPLCATRLSSFVFVRRRLSRHPNVLFGNMSTSAQRSQSVTFSNVRPSVHLLQC